MPLFACGETAIRRVEAGRCPDGTYSSKGPTLFNHLAKPDLVAPGNRIRGLLVRNSTLAREHPELVIGTGRNASLELSGTSMAAAAVSGAVATLFEDKLINPEMTRHLLQQTASKVPGHGRLLAGAGALSLGRAAAVVTGVGASAWPAAEGDEPSLVSFCTTATCGDPAANATGTPLWAQGIIWGEGDGIIWGESDAIIWGEGIIWGE